MYSMYKAKGDLKDYPHKKEKEKMLSGGEKYGRYQNLNAWMNGVQRSTDTQKGRIGDRTFSHYC